jgi:hypothetical protein
MYLCTRKILHTFCYREALVVGESIRSRIVPSGTSFLYCKLFSIYISIGLRYLWVHEGTLSHLSVFIPTCLIKEFNNQNKTKLSQQFNLLNLAFVCTFMWSFVLVVKWTSLFIHETKVSTCIQYFPEDGYRESATEYLSKVSAVGGRQTWRIFLVLLYTNADPSHSQTGKWLKDLVPPTILP